MNRFMLAATALGGLVMLAVSGCACGPRGQCCLAPPGAVPAADEAPRSFVGSSYAFNPPGSCGAGYESPPYEPNYSGLRPYVANYYGAFPRSAARYQGAEYYEPGPYYYSTVGPYTFGYYSYYYTPGFFRY